jgi:cobalt-zinc-cadmium efflux system protein
VFILREAYLRLLSPPEIKTTEMLIVAVIGLVVNIYVTFTLRGHHDLNMRGAYLHVLGDTLSSFGVIVGGILIILTGNHVVDPILGFLIAGVIIYGAIRLIKESVEILMERTPKHIDVDILKEEIAEVRGVIDIHDLHVWSICSNVHALNAHVLVDSISVKETENMTSEINHRLLEKFGISHITLQFECTDCTIKNMD